MPARCLSLLGLLIYGLNAQTCLSLSTAAVAPGGTASLELLLTAPSEAPASLQWTLQASGLSRLAVDNGPAATAAAKTILCNGDASSYTCLAVGANANTMGNGVVAKVTAALAPNVVTAVIRIGHTLGVSADGYYIPIASENGVVTSANVSPDGRLRPPLRRVPGGRCLARR